MPDVTRDFDIIERIETIIVSTTIFRITAEGIAVGKLLGELKNCRAAPDVGAVELPEPFGFLETARGVTESAYSADQMQAYAREAIAADRARRDVPQAPGESVDTPEFRAILAGYVSAHMGLYSRAEREQECSALIAHIDAYAARRAARPRIEMPPEMKAAIEEAHKTRATSAVLPNGSAVFINYGHDFGDNDHLNCTACGGSGHIDDQQDIASRAASTAGVAVPEGWKLVPVEPTPAMLNAADSYSYACSDYMLKATPVGYYRAMLAAAPLPPQEGA